MNTIDLSVLNQDALHARLLQLVRRLESWPHVSQEEQRAMEPVPSLDALRRAFGLTGFETDVLLLAAGCELSSELARLCASAGGGRGPSLGLCLAVLPEAHWDALTPMRALRRWRLIEIEDQRSLTRSALRVPERVLHFIAGIGYLDPQLAACAASMPEAMRLPDSYHTVAADVVRYVEQASEVAPCVQITGDEAGAALQLAHDIAGTLSLDLLPIDTARLSCDQDIESVCRLIERECLLLPALPAIKCDDAASQAFACRVVDGLGVRLLVLSHAPVQCRRRHRIFRLDRPCAMERSALWRDAMGAPLAEKFNGELELLANQYPFGAHEISIAGAQIRERVDGGEMWRSAVTSVCRVMAGTRLDDLAERIPARAQWDDLVLPEAQRDMLAQIVSQVRARHRVYGEWGFGAKLSRGQGVSALFSGESGTGKTMAAEVVAAELGLDLYRIDLSGVVSKYIGETEKNLAHVFSAAQESGAVLLFDEADALFGKRSEVKDSHDRYANIEVSYLLQRMEAYSGLAILTTNQRSALDQAFERRLRFIVHFPFPATQEREAIWRKTFPPQTPLLDIDFSRLARLHVTGGGIRNIALNAAFLAAGAARPVGMADLAQAARAEIAKVERPTGEAQIRSWL